MVDWKSIFDPNLPIVEILIRGTVTYLGLLTLLRIVGQREAGAIGVHDLLVIILIAEASQNGLSDDYRAIPDGFLLVATVLTWSVVIDAIGWRWPRVDRIVKPRARPLVMDGKVNHRVLRRELMTMDELTSQLRLHGVADLAEVKRAYFEPNGMISVIRMHGGEPDRPERHAFR